MPFHQPDQIRYYTFDVFQDAPLTHAVFTRRGGVSPSPWDELNVGATVGDNLDNVAKNRQLCFDAAGRHVDTLFDSWLVHGTDVLIADAPQPRPRLLKTPPKADIILTDKPHVTLFMRFADCLPILLYDPVNHAVGLLHAGWMGTVKRAIQVAVEVMQAHFGSDPSHIQAAIGPSISPENYEVGPQVIAQVEETFGGDATDLLPTYNGSTHFDLWNANRLLLNNAGVRTVEIAGICTASNLEDWYSHRAEGGKTGRFGALVALEPR